MGDFEEQYKEAKEILKQGMVCAPISYHDEIPLQHKQMPTYQIAERQQQEQSQEEKKDSHENDSTKDNTIALQDIESVSSRGYVDVSLLQELVTEGYNNFSKTTNKETTNNNANFLLQPSFWGVVLVAIACYYFALEEFQYYIGVSVLLLFMLWSSGAAITSNKKQTKTKSTPKQHEMFQRNHLKHFTSSDVKSETNLWDEANAFVNNVSIVRASHDAWGIGKVVLIFCDDYLRQIYELPWWHMRDDIQQAVKPILEALNLTSELLPPTIAKEEDQKKVNDEDGENKNIIVRMLLASLPPGGNIPVHHDTGEWVKYTHRVHVPIIVKDPDNILFRVGLTETTLKRIDCTPGHVFEINNQCKHAVSNCTSDHRVHLILDYIQEKDLMYFRQHYGHTTTTTTTTSDSQEKRCKLQPGERLRQTRRTIDRLGATTGTCQIPGFLILGAQRAGVQPFVEHISQHPLVKFVKSPSHAFDWNWPANPEQFSSQFMDDKFALDDDDETCKYRTYIQHKFFNYKELKDFPSLLVGDGTPTYLLDSHRVIERLSKYFPWDMKFLAILRDPIHRAVMHYGVATTAAAGSVQIRQGGGKKWDGKSFQEAIYEDLRNMKDCGLIPYWDIEKGVHDTEMFQEFVGTPAENQAWTTYLQKHVPLHSDQHSLVSSGLYELNLRPWFQAFDKSNNGIDPFCIVQLDNMLQRDPNESMKLVWEHLCVPEHPIETKTMGNTSQLKAMQFPMKEYLQNFYKPHNQRLGEILRKRLDSTGDENHNEFNVSCWEGDVWKYD